LARPAKEGENLMTALALANPKFPNTNGWQDRHNSAMRIPHPGFEAAMVQLLTGWYNYAETHRRRYSSDIGEDGVLGEAWADIGTSIRALLNGDLGRMDGGTLDGFISDTLQHNSIDPNQ